MGGVGGKARGQLLLIRERIFIVPLLSHGIEKRV